MHKIVIIGDHGVGKSSVISMFIHGDLEHDIFNVIGVNFSRKTVRAGDENVDLQIWDVYSDNSNTLSRSYFRGAAGVVIVFDVTDPQSFDKIKEKLKCVDKPFKFPVFLVGNKIDLISQRAISKEDAELFSKGNGIEYFEVSAVENTDVLLTFETIASKATNSSNPY